MANTLIPIQTYTLSSSAASVTFSNIPQNYTDLKLVISPRSDGGTTANDGRMTFNGSASGYSSRLLYGLGSGTPSSASNSGTYMYWINSTNSNGLTASTFSNTEIYIPNYTSSNQKSVSCDTVTENNGTYGAQLLTAGLWTGTSAITSISFSLDYGNFVSNSTFTLYGISNGVKATGGTLTVAGGYAYHTFTSTGALAPNQIIRNAEVLLVAGGGGGSSANGSGAGGGAGGVISSITGTLNAGTSYLATVGAGGGGSDINNSGNNGRTGNNSTFASAVIALGGGGGTATVDGNGYAQSGGSGGGATPAPSGTRFGGLGTVGQGNNGGIGATWGGAYGAGGGGGAGGVGSNGSSSVSGNGGIGTSDYTTWLSLTGTGVLSSGLYYVAGGGAGGARTTGTGGTGGIGGGAVGSSTSTGTAGTANTGGGGSGAGGTDGLAAGGAGGSGLVIVRYRLD